MVEKWLRSGWFGRPLLLTLWGVQTADEASDSKGDMGTGVCLRTPTHQPLSTHPLPLPLTLWAVRTADEASDSKGDMGTGVCLRMFLNMA